MPCLFTNMVFLLLITLSNGYVEPIVLVHGGVDNYRSSRADERIEGVKQAAMAAYKILKNGGSVTDAVETAVRTMEGDNCFNAGRGSNMNIDGDIEMDAAIMTGNLSSGAVTVIKNVEHPITVARMVMEKTPYFLMAGDGAKRFASGQGVPLVATKRLIGRYAKQDFADFLKATKEKRKMTVYGSVGAVAVDQFGHVAAATSSGGRLGRLPGRSAVASIVGAGLYADDDVGAVVVTGNGEAIAHYVMSHELIGAMKRGFEVGLATRNTVKGITEKYHKNTGAITLSKYGQVGISFTADKMPWAYQIRDNLHFGVDDYDHFSEKIKI